MNPASDLTGTTEARVLLDRLPGLLFSILKSSHVEQQSVTEACCSFEIPVLGKRTKVAPTALEATRAALLELTDFLSRIPPHDWPEEWRHAAATLPPAAQSTSPPVDCTVKRFQAKARKLTIGVTMPISLKTSLQSIAERQSVSFAETARQLVRCGFDDFDERSYSEESEELLALLLSEIRKWQPSETEQVMVRTDPHLAIRLRSAAKEYHRSVSEFGAMCLAHGLVLQTQFVEIEKKIAAYRGAAIRKLAPQVGLGTQVALLSGILAGTICAPKKVLGRLSEVLEAPQRVLTDFFQCSFERRAIPAFKAENGKPQVTCSATPWEEAVNSLRLPAEQVRELLQLDA